MSFPQVVRKTEYDKVINERDVARKRVRELEKIRTETIKYLKSPTQRRQTALLELINDASETTEKKAEE